MNHHLLLLWRRSRPQLKEAIPTSSGDKGRRVIVEKLSEFGQGISEDPGLFPPGEREIFQISANERDRGLKLP